MTTWKGRASRSDTRCRITSGSTSTNVWPHPSGAITAASAITPAALSTASMRGPRPARRHNSAITATANAQLNARMAGPTVIACSPVQLRKRSGGMAKRSMNADQRLIRDVDRRLVETQRQHLGNIMTDTLTAAQSAARSPQRPAHTPRHRRCAATHSGSTSRSRPSDRVNLQPDANRQQRAANGRKPRTDGRQTRRRRGARTR